MKVGGTIAYDMQIQARQHYGNLTTWSLNDILNKIGLDSKEDLSIEHIDCQAPKEIYEKLFKNVQYSLMSKISCITVQEYALGNMTNMINNLIVDYSYRRNINLSFSYMKNDKFKQKYSGGYMRELKYKGFSITPKRVLDFNSLYPSVMREKNICLLIFSDTKKKGIEYHEILFNRKTAYFEKNKEGLIPYILKSLVDLRSQAKVDKKNNKDDEFKYNYYEELQLALKKLANSIYGQFGSSLSILNNYMISASVTAFGRKYLVEVSEFAESRMVKELNISEFIWEYSDTDSIFVSRNPYFTNQMIHRYKEKYIYELKFINIEQYYMIINGQDKKNIWMKHVFENITEEFIKYLYQKETELDMELFEMTGRNNTENDDEEILIIEIMQTNAFKTNNWKYENGKIILYEKNN
ncbi:13482_t:CDS:2 [Dentiscutata heterogama]|uniref:13482_t:CDS:1 n=1 Tax=Dentiscutata heterogama TaxID=1316150 RepID=A0ACA9MLX3_9GLOM|nr:13482_t:CDS:2 [Dentiscutata heterogama]